MILLLAQRTAAVSPPPVSFIVAVKATVTITPAAKATLTITSD